MSEMHETGSYGTPGLLSLMREGMGVQPLPQTKAIDEAVKVGFTAASAVSGKTWDALTSRNEQTGMAEGAVAYATDAAIGWAKRRLFGRGGLL